jgi:hypothetical protein
MKRIAFILSLFCCLGVAKSQTTEVLLSKISVDRDDNGKITSYIFLWRVGADTVGPAVLTTTLPPADSVLTFKNLKQKAFTALKQALTDIFSERQKAMLRAKQRTEIVVNDTLSVN